MLIMSSSTFVLETDLTLPDQLISFIRLLLFPKEEWDKTRDKGKLPKPKIDGDLIAVALEGWRKGNETTRQRYRWN